MGFAASLATLLVASTLTLWAAMSAGRAKTSGVRFGWLAVELVALLGALGPSAFASIAIASPNQNALGFFVLFTLFTGIGFACAGVLVYFEYLRRGYRDRFRPDLRGSLWVGRFGIDRPFGGRLPRR